MWHIQPVPPVRRRMASSSSRDLKYSISSTARASLCWIEGRKGSIARGLDADIVFLDRDLAVDTVVARGRVMVRGGAPLVKGPFEV